MEYCGSDTAKLEEELLGKDAYLDELQAWNGFLDEGFDTMCTKYKEEADPTYMQGVSTDRFDANTWESVKEGAAACGDVCSSWVS